ncbi:serine/threonine protein phosphatase [Wenjunlia vitaminophila]|uniref:protein-serine/threonine phosphatase n=1 Tax=Wenjunlia vitaminophila TaxID=76728 RepID=A0A0T6LUU6_WENVI|nr:SpoIIE family protein phosphatase [Wenjunlia vitaminophila]KRV49745.1 serine/threonine protein phosphatase [Wenjunlia vitaminophila]
MDTDDRLGLEVVDRAPVGVLVTMGPEHVVSYMNDLCRRIFGDRPTGRPTRVVFPDLVPMEQLRALDHVYSTGEPLQIRDHPVTMRFPDDAEAESPERERFFTFWLSAVTVPERDRGVLVVSVEVTDQVAAARRNRNLVEELRRTLERYGGLVRASTDMIWVTSAGGGVIEPSPGWEAATGQPWEQFRGRGWLDAIHPEDRPGVEESWSHALAEVPETFESLFRLRMRDGSHRHHQLKAVPVRGDARVMEWIGTCTDVEDRHRREELLARAAAATSDTLRLDQMLPALAHVVVPALADACDIYLFPQSAEPPPGIPLVVERAAITVRAGLPVPPPLGEVRFRPEGILGRVVAERRPIYSRFDPGRIAESVAPAATRDWLEAARANSQVLLPVLVDGAVAAVIGATVCGDREPISTDDMEMLRQILDNADALLSHAVRSQRTQAVSLALQRSLLSEPPEVPGLDMVARYRPSSAAAEVGGDWYDAFVLPSGPVVLAIGDVTGHDLSAAVTMSQLRNMLRGLTLDRQEPPEEIVRRLDVTIHTLYEETTATCVLSRVEQGEDGGWQFNYTVAGHPPPLLVTRDGRATYLEEATGLLLGVLLRPRIGAVVPLPPGSTLLLYTDGLVERPGESVEQGLQRLRRHASALANAPLDLFCDQILAWSRSEARRDDIALIATRVLTEEDSGGG